jgi:aminopeptidase N
MRLRFVLPLVAALPSAWLAACAEQAAPVASAPVGSTATTPAPPALTAPEAIEPAPPPAEDGRLPALAVPRRYALTFSIDPTKDRFSGTTTILVDAPAATHHVVLHGRDLDVRRVTALAGGRALVGSASARAARGAVHAEELVLTFPSAIQGQVILEIAYEAPFAADLAGAYRVNDQGAWYAFTQFEAADARRAFPCFDEPGYKTPFDVTIQAPRGMLALSNGTEAAREEGPSGTVFHFATTKPLPSYLVAFAVGNFDVVPLPVAATASRGFPIRLVAPKGKGVLGGLALEATAALVDKLGEYFDLRYPYDKLDVVAVPDFQAGAMENAGLITFRQELLLVDPNRSTTSIRRAQAAVIAHELAHQWVGDLVTMKWWDDLWLNEGFATWMQARAVDAWRPSFGARMEQVSGTQGVMNLDALESARAVRQPVASTSEAMESFDGLTYGKGAAVLEMLNQWLGPDVFQRGVRSYVRANAYGNARADDLLEKLAEASGKVVRPVAMTFLNKPGVPEVELDPACAAGKAKLALKQKEWRPLGEPRREGSFTWIVPVCVEVDGKKDRTCSVLSSDTEMDVDGARCPAWVYPNADQAGYYRYTLPSKDLGALARDHTKLDPADQVGLVANLWAAVRAGELAPSEYMRLLPEFDRDTSRLVVEQIVASLVAMNDALVDDASRPAFRAYVRARLGARARALGWEPAKGPLEDDDRALLRGTLLRAMGELAEDDATLKEADAYARKWLADPASVPADTAQIAVELASLRAGPDRLDALRAAAKGAKLPQDRILALRAMGALTDPAALGKALDLFLTDEVRMSEGRHLLGSAAGHRATRKVLFERVKSHWDALRTKLPGHLVGGFAGLAANACTTADRDAARAFLEPHLKDVEGTKRPLAESLETAGLCAALHDHGADDTARFLAAGRP